MDNSKREIIDLLGSFREKYPNKALPHFAGDIGFAEIILPGTEITTPPVKVSNFTDIKRLIAESGSDKASFRRISEAAWEYSETDFDDVYIPGGANIWRYLTDEQLHCYYSRREDFKKGIFNTKYPTYIYIYIAECLIRENAAENLAFILANTAFKYPNIKSDLCRFIKDYYIVNENPLPFSEYIESIGAENFFPSYMNPPADDFDAKLYSAGDYDISKSRFLGERFEIRRDFPKIFNAVLTNSISLFSLFCIDKVVLIRSDSGDTEYYYPFTGVLYAGEFSRTTEAVLTNSETYVRRGTWFMRSVSVIPSYSRKFSGFIKRQIDANLRLLTDYKYPLSDNAKALSESMEALGGSRLSEKLAKMISSKILDEIIREICTEYLKGKDGLLSFSGLTLHEKMRTEPLLSYKKIQSSDTNPLRNLDIDEYSEYLSWRNNIENGVYENSDFIKTYISEVAYHRYTEPLIGFEKLALVTANFNSSAIRKIMQRVLRDYYHTHKFSETFPELIEKYKITEAYPEIFIRSENKELRAEAVIKLSGKNIKMPPELNSLYLAVIDKIYENINAHIKINPSEFIPDKKLFPLVLSFFVKLSEQIIKRELSFPGKINLESHAHFSVKFEEKCNYSVPNYRLWRDSKAYFLSEEFPAMIEETVCKVLREDFPDIKIYPGKKPAKKQKSMPPEIAFTPIEVKVDFSKLDRVREEADEIAKKLAPEEIPDTPVVIKTPEKPVITSTDNPYEDYYNALEAVYKEILALILSGGDVNGFLLAKNILPEVAAEHLNELALNFTGDIILEGMNIIDDYLLGIKKVVKM
ncbi:MAG: hypothetical protein LBM59_06840 [Ruminococcus sp.]|jgi:hypothetical protein|nr:hypothetical protein [Ruminococcus sp.]